MHDSDKPDDNVQDIPESGPWSGPPACVIDVSDPFALDGKRVMAITARHSDGFVCLNFEDVEKSATDTSIHNDSDAGLSF